MKSTFKKSLFFAAWCVAFLFGTVAFHSCSNEDLDEDSVQSKAELFRAKAKELSKKYGVDVTLNEENIEKMAETLTMEQFEKEFQMFATMKIDTVLVGASHEGISKKLRFKTRKRMSEIHQDSVRDNVYWGSIKIEKTTVTIPYKIWDELERKDKDREAIYSISGNADWSFQQTGPSSVNVSLEISGAPQATGGGSINILSGIIDKGKVSFDARGHISISSSLFKKSLMCSVIHNGDYPEQDRVIITRY